MVRVRSVLVVTLLVVKVRRVENQVKRSSSANIAPTKAKAVSLFEDFKKNFP
jgi:hypothetical protein